MIGDRWITVRVVCSSWTHRKFALYSSSPEKNSRNSNELIDSLLKAQERKTKASTTTLSIVYVLRLGIGAWQHTIGRCSNAENYMTSVERIITNTHLEQEPG
ncbi:uncharacterized protein [Montipora capricornis]|uniref:uncharacterized protein n=1 Tax=Montipora capricornis TaxID=246305 RepID=UPI0035F1C211